jgi:hypothetical protein
MTTSIHAMTVAAPVAYVWGVTEARKGSFRSLTPLIPSSLNWAEIEAVGAHSGVKRTFVARVMVEVGLMTKWPWEGRVKGVQC